jgi:hypothetical protein
VHRERIVAVGLLTQRDINMLGQSFDRLWPVDETPCFGELLHAIDEADREIRQERAAHSKIAKGVIVEHIKI